MQKTSVKPRVLTSILTLAAVAALALVLLFTLRGKADEPAGEIGDFSYQTISGDSLGSASTSLRFLFTVGKLDYTRVGFVFSKTNIDPMLGGSGCSVWEPSNGKVYRSVRANGEKIDADPGRYWVAVKVTDVPNASFDEPIYVKPFVQDGSGIRYGELHAISAEGAFTIPTLETQIAAFANSDFGGGSVTANLGNGTDFNALAKNPTKGQHPRVLYTESALAGIRTAFKNAPGKTKDDCDSVATRYASVIAEPTDGDLSGGFRSRTLNDIQLLALDYRMTGNPYSGYLAVYAIKNALNTMGDWTRMDDCCRYYGMVMYNAACVYDWCYDLLSDADKQQIVLGVQNKVCTDTRMEIGFPPSKQNAVTGHGAELQLLRDYLAFAIAIYDEYPGWWNYIGNRFYTEFVPVRNDFYEAGMVPQGVSLYVRLRFASDLYSAWLVRTATGTFPYASEENMKQVMRTVYSYELSSSAGVYCFDSGDNQTNDRIFQDYGRDALISSYLFNDRTIRKELEVGKWSCSQFDDNVTMRASVAEYLICSSGGVTASDRHEGMSLILYNGGWLGQIIARDAWSNYQAATLMKIGCRTSGNHDHADAGSFQIWYKGMLAGDTGSYDKYGDTHFTNYHQATIAHNSILVNGSGQRQPSEPGSYANWQTDTYKTGEVTGVSYGYNGSDPTYAYIAGDITPAYNSSTVTEANRRMLTVFDTADENEELYFFVFDNVTGKYGSYKKTFLLHVPTEPTINGKTVTVVNPYGAKLVLQNVFGGDSVTGIGGTNRNYVVNGSQINPTNNGDDGFWGRVEISPNTGSKTDQMLNVMYVCDEDDPNELTATSISNSTVKGAVLGNTAAVFVISSTRRSTSFSFTNGAEGTFNYYISGVAEGDWAVSVGGNLVGLAHATAEGGLLTFTAPGGAVSLAPYNGSGLVHIDVLEDFGWNEMDFSEIEP